MVDTFSNLADEKRVHDQMALFTENAEVTTYIGGELFADLKGRAQVEEVFTAFLAQFHTVYHINGQHNVTINGTQAEGINYCQVTLVDKKDGKNIITQHGVLPSAWQILCIAITTKWAHKIRCRKF